MISARLTEAMVAEITPRRQSLASVASDLVKARLRWAVAAERVAGAVDDIKEPQLLLTAAE